MPLFKVFNRPTDTRDVIEITVWQAWGLLMASTTFASFEDKNVISDL